MMTGRSTGPGTTLAQLYIHNTLQYNKNHSGNDVVDDDNESTSGIAIQYQTDDGSLVSLTHPDTRDCLKKHEQWLVKLIEDCCCSSTTTNTIKNNGINTTTPATTCDDLVIAYLSMNSVDMFLSMLACSSLVSSAFTFDGSSIPSSSFSSSLSSSSTSSSPRNCTALSAVALLNTRWSANEMIASLQSKAGTRRRENVKTIILYGNGYDIIANDVISKLDHVAFCIPIIKRQQLVSSVSFDSVLVPNSVPVPSLRNHDVLLPVSSASSSSEQNNYNDNDDNLNKLKTYIETTASTNDAFIIFTSGTTRNKNRYDRSNTNANSSSPVFTSTPKGVRLSHKSIAIQSWAKLSAPCRYCSSTIMNAMTVPLYHIGGLSSCYATLLAGGCLVFSNNRTNTTKQDASTTTTATTMNSFNPQQVLHTLNGPYHVNTLVVVPAMLSAIFQYIKNTDTEQMSRLTSKNNNDNNDNFCYPLVKLVLIGGQSASNIMIGQIQNYFPNAKIVQTYAFTEASSSVTFLQISNDSDTGTKYSFNKKKSNNKETSANISISGDCVGTSPDHVDIRLLRQVQDEKQRNVRKIITVPFVPGLIATRGPHVMNGYWRRGGTDTSTTETKKTQHGWFVSSDLGYYDEDGMLYFCGRATDTIRTGGETVMAQEVERVLSYHPSIVECAVFPTKDERFGEIVSCAVVVSSSSSSSSPVHGISLDNLKDWCTKHGLAKYKRPRRLLIVDSLPRNSSGKVVKYKLVEPPYTMIRSKL